jgi:hypothetical protein
MILAEHFDINSIFYMTDKKKANMTINSNADDSITNSSSMKYIINVCHLMPTICVDVTMLLTFGLASPLIAIIISLSMITNVFLWRLALGRYITIINKTISSSTCNELLETIFGDEWRCITSTWWIVCISIGIFWSIFVFDMISESNTNSGIAACVIMIVWCPLVFVSIQYLITINPDYNDSNPFSMISKLRVHSNSIASFIHDSIWRYVFQDMKVKSNSASSTSINPISTTSTTGTETISPLRSVVAV